FVDADDIADVATAALTQAGHAGETYELTGPRSLTFAQAVEEIAATTGHEIAFVEVPMDAYAAAARAEGVPSDVVDLLTYLFSEVLDGRNIAVAAGVVYLAGLIALTGAYHVPRNNALDRVDAAGAEAPAAWRHFADPWIRGNHVRALAGVLAAGLFTAALRLV